MDESKVLVLNFGAHTAAVRIAVTTNKKVIGLRRDFKILLV